MMQIQTLGRIRETNTKSSAVLYHKIAIQVECKWCIPPFFEVAFNTVAFWRLDPGFESLALRLGPSIYDIHTEGGGSQAQVDACGWGRGSSPMWTSTQKIKIRSPLTSYCRLLMQRTWRIFFTRISSLDR